MMRVEAKRKVAREWRIYDPTLASWAMAEPDRPWLLSIGFLSDTHLPPIEGSSG
jgi:hypothetical protein